MGRREVKREREGKRTEKEKGKGEAGLKYS
jgi:hypothetical protein